MLSLSSITVRSCYSINVESNVPQIYIQGIKGLHCKLAEAMLPEFHIKESRETDKDKTFGYWLNLLW